ncbi:hypothetical protein LINPERPRIM_LOCUS4409 [Linum perenne]
MVQLLCASTYQDRRLKLGKASSSNSGEGERHAGVLEHLKVLEFAGYIGGTMQEGFILHIANNAAALKTIIIDPNYQLDTSSITPRDIKENVLPAPNLDLQKIVPAEVNVNKQYHFTTIFYRLNTIYFV